MENKQNMTLEEFKEEVAEGNININEEQEELEPFSAMLKEHSEEFESCKDIEEFCDLFQTLCEEYDFWDKKRKEYCIRLHKAGKAEYAFTMIWNWILAGVPNKNYTAR